MHHIKIHLSVSVLSSTWTATAHHADSSELLQILTHYSTSWRRWTVLKSKLTSFRYHVLHSNPIFRPDNQPEFMQNLGFVADSGVPEMYSFSSQIEPFLLAQTQQIPSNGSSSGVRRESQSLSMSGTPKR
jgi:hypothetical protein